MFKTGHLFAGAGGGLLADLILEHKPIFALDSDTYCCRILRRKKDEGWFPGLQVLEQDIRLFDPSTWQKRVDCIHAGFPCQDISPAGKGKGITGQRSGLIWEFFRVIKTIDPPIIFLENSPFIRTRGRREIIRELVSLGYTFRDGTLAASDVGAPHVRKRWFCFGIKKEKIHALFSYFDRIRQKNGAGCETITPAGKNISLLSSGMASGEKAHARKKVWFEVEPALDRLVYGVADGLVPGKAIMAMGNGQVPIQVALAFILLSGYFIYEIGEENNE